MLTALLGMIFWLTWRNHTFIKEVVSNDFNQQQLILARQVSHDIHTAIQDIRTNLYFEGDFESRTSRGSRLLENELAATYHRVGQKGVLRIYCLLPDGITLVTDSSGVSEVALDSSARLRYLRRLNEGRDGRSFIANTPWTMDSEGRPRRLVEMGTSFELTNGRTCVLVVILDASYLVKYVSQGVRSGETGYCWVIDDEGRFLYHPKSDFIGKNAYHVREERMPDISFDRINRIQADKMLEGEEGTSEYVSGWHRDIVGEMEKLIAYSPLRIEGADWNWSVAVVAPVSEVRSVLQRMFIRQTVLEGLLIVGIFIISFTGFVYKRRLAILLSRKLRRTERSLHQTEEYYRSIFESALDPIYLIDKDHRFMSMNMFTAKILCGASATRNGEEECEYYAPEQFIGMGLPEILSEKDAEFLEEKVRLVFARKKAETFEHRFWVGDRRIYFNTRYIPIFEEDDTVSSVLGISRDITEKKEMEHLIYHTEKLASMGTLAAGVAHEINNPLGIILGFTDLLIDRTPKDSQEYGDLKIIEENCVNCKRIVENLMSFARVTEGLEDVVDLNTSIGTVTKVVQNTLLTSKVSLVLDVQEHLPRVRGDAREIQQVLFNLINNAVYAMRDRGGNLTIGTVVQDDSVEIAVADQGTGIPRSVGNSVFDPFFTTKKVGEGTGLGLSVSYGIVKKYGGSIRYTSVAEEEAHDGEEYGTEFIVSLPIFDEASPASNDETRKDIEDTEETK
jgi:signal transduction histidine kinase